MENPTVVRRQFKFKDEIIPDPNPSLHPNEVVTYLTDTTHPELLNATVQHGGEDEDGLITFNILLKGSNLG